MVRAQLSENCKYKAIAGENENRQKANLAAKPTSKLPYKSIFLQVLFQFAYFTINIRITENYDKHG